MAVTIGNNISSLNAQRQLAKATDANSKVQERLSSGLRINSAADDAAGLAVSASLKTDSRIFTQAIRNVSDGISVINIASGAIDALSTIITRQQELAEQAANGTYSRKQRAALNSEANSLMEEYSRIAATTSFNGIKLLDGSTSSGVRIQLGVGVENSLSFDTSQGVARNVNDGTFQSVQNSSGTTRDTLTAADVNNDGVLDLVSLGTDGGGGYFNVTLGNGDGSFNATQKSYIGGNFSNIPFAEKLSFADLNNDGNLDVVTGLSGNQAGVFLGDGKGNFSIKSSYIAATAGTPAISTTIGDFNGDEILDFATATDFFTGTSEVKVFQGLGDGTFNLSASFNTVFGQPTGVYIRAGDFNGDGRSDIVLGGSDGASFYSFLSLASGGFSPLSSQSTSVHISPPLVADFDNDGLDDVIAGQDGVNSYRSLGTTDPSTPLGPVQVFSGFGADAVADIDGDGILDLVSAANDTVTIAKGDGKGGFTLLRTLADDPAASHYSFVVGDFNGDGANDILRAGNVAGHQYSIFFGNTQKTVRQEKVDLLSRTDALKELSRFTNLLGTLNLARSNLGAQYSRLQTSSNVLSVSRENYDAANSRITDADVAEESAALIQSRIIQQSAASILAQANQQPGLALQLLRG